MNKALQFSVFKRWDRHVLMCYLKCGCRNLLVSRQAQAEVSASRSVAQVRAEKPTFVTDMELAEIF